MGKVIYDITMSLDGFITAANVRPEAGLYFLLMEETMTTLQTSAPQTETRDFTRRAALAGMIGPALFTLLVILYNHTAI